jgi:hypothetical protein
MEHTATDAQDHRAMTAYQCLEASFVASRDECLKKIPIGETSTILKERRSAQVLDQAVSRATGHSAFPEARQSRMILIIDPRHAGAPMFFCFSSQETKPLTPDVQ